MAEEKSLSSHTDTSTDSDKDKKLNLLLDMCKPENLVKMKPFKQQIEAPENNTVYVELLNHYPAGGRFPRFNKIQKIIFFHLHESVHIPAKSWKFVNLNVSIKMPDYYVYTLSNITSFLAGKGLSIVPINLTKGSVVRIIVELHNISNQAWQIHKDTTLFEIRFMTHYNVEIRDWSTSSTYANKTRNSLEKKETSQETSV